MGVHHYHTDMGKKKRTATPRKEENAEKKKALDNYMK